MARVRNSRIGRAGFAGKTFGISGIETDKAGATTHKASRNRRGGGLLTSSKSTKPRKVKTGP